MLEIQEHSLYIFLRFEYFYIEGSDNKMAQEINVPGDFLTIQAAITAANDYDTIRVAPGTYTGPITIDKMIQLLGAQAGVDARTRTGSPGSESIITGTSPIALVQLLDNNIVVDGFTIENNSAGSGILTSNAFSGYWIFNNIVQNNVIGLYMNSNGSTESQVKQNVFNNNNQSGAATGNGIYSDQGIQNLLIESNRFTGPHANASINMIGTSVPAIPATDIIISRNEMITDNSIALTNTGNVAIACNTLTNTQGSSIFFGGGTDRTDINNNILQNSISNGINVTTVFSGTTNSNIRAKNNNIQGNANAGLNIVSGAYVSPRRLDATNNWWGSPDGPSGDGPGSGDAVFDPDNVAEFVPFLTAPPIPCTNEFVLLQLLAATQQELAATQQELAATQQELAATQQQLAATQRALALAQQRSLACRRALALAQQQLEKCQAELRQKRINENLKENMRCFKCGSNPCVCCNPCECC
ncbi:hypothetical protein [Peribacillus frigoritolerans]|uniref:Right handed beta helix domain-containing protein n=1 Tax=Peribacillus frigoritolerans TaxID=450367 RepID=A0AAJ1VA96_9BACI|nr:hypothetical protein [Peribacillus frigoritolerans]MDM5281965.1 hypothetical protein [Peribacillus frigoritolerans]